MWDLQTLNRLNAEVEAKQKQEASEGELEFEEARRLDTRNKD
jgi:hypothetical protein